MNDSSNVSILNNNNMFVRGCCSSGVHINDGVDLADHIDVGIDMGVVDVLIVVVVVVVALGFVIIGVVMVVVENYVQCFVHIFGVIFCHFVCWCSYY